MRPRTIACISPVALLAGACILDAVDVGDSFTGGAPADEPPGAPTTGAPLPDLPVPGDTSDLPDDPPADPPPPSDPPPGDPLLDKGGKLHTALDGCAFNLVWTKGPQYNQGTGLAPDHVAAHDETSLEFLPSDLNAWVFPGVFGASVLRLRLLGIDETTGEHVLGGEVLGPEAVLTLPPLRFDPAQPIVLTDATVQDPASQGPGLLTSLVDGTETVLDDFAWGLVVDLNGGSNPACAPILEPVFGPL